MINKPRDRDGLCFTIAMMTTNKTKKQITPAMIPSTVLGGKSFCSSLFAVRKYCI